MRVWPRRSALAIRIGLGVALFLLNSVPLHAEQGKPPIEVVESLLQSIENGQWRQSQAFIKTAQGPGPSALLDDPGFCDRLRREAKWCVIGAEPESSESRWECLVTCQLSQSLQVVYPIRLAKRAGNWVIVDMGEPRWQRPGAQDEAPEVLPSEPDLSSIQSVVQDAVSDSKPLGEVLRDKKASPVILAACLRHRPVEEALALIPRLEEEGSKESIGLLSEFLRDPEDAVAWEASLALARIGQPAGPRLLKLSADPSAKVRWKVESSFCGMEGDILESIRELLSGAAPGSRRSGAWIAGERKESRVAPQLLKALQDPDERVRWKAASSLCRLGAGVLPELRKAMSPNLPVESRLCAAWTLGEVGDASCAQALIAGLDDPSEEVQWKAAESLRKHPDWSLPALRRTWEALSSPVLLQAVWLLGEIGEATDVPRLEPLTKLEDPKIAGAAREALLKITWPNLEAQTLSQDLPSDFDITFKTALPAARPPDLEIRILCHAQGPASGLCVRFGPDDVTLFAMQDGRPHRFGWGQPHAALGQLGSAAVTVQRRGGALRVWVDGQLAAEGFDERFSGGALLIGCQPPSLQPTEVQVQPVADVAFEDDFMRSPGAPSEWRIDSGNWALSNTTEHSANPFTWAASGDGLSRCLAGYPWWEDLKAVTAAKSSAATMGLLVGTRKDQGLKLTVKAGEDPSVVLAVQNGAEEKVLAKKPFSMEPARWVEMELACSDGQAHVEVDGQPIYDGACGAIQGGEIGLFSESGETLFDDVEVLPQVFHRDGFDRGLARWRVLSGQWQPSPEQGGETPAGLAIPCFLNAALGRADTFKRPVLPGQCIASSWTGLGCMISGRPHWQDVAVRVTLSKLIGSAGLACSWKDERNFDAVWLSRVPGGTARAWVSETRSGETRILCAREGIEMGEGGLELRLRPDQGRLSAGVGDQWDVGLPHSAIPGGIALLTSSCAFAVFDDLAVDSLSPDQPLQTESRFFAGNEKMEAWATSQSTWHLDGPSEIWHAGVFYGQALIRYEWPDPGLPAGASMSVCARPIGSDTRWISRSIRAGEKRILLRMEGPGVAVQEIPLPSEAGTEISMQLDETALSSSSGGPSGLKMTHPSWSQGYSLGLQLENISWDPSRVSLSSPNMVEEFFETAPVGWRCTSGTCGVARRWACNPNWSWMSLVSEDLATLWGPWTLSGNQTMEAFLGLKTQLGSEPYYQTRGDLGVAFCGDGEDPRSGYAFLFGGNDNASTQFYRKGEVVAQTTQFLFPTGADYHEFHWRWFHLRMVKTGSQIVCTVDDQEVFRFEDPEPLQEGGVAVWTQKKGIMISRVRLSAEKMRRSTL